MLVAWAVGGVLAMFGALSYGGLGVPVTCPRPIRTVRTSPVVRCETNTLIEEY